MHVVVVTNIKIKDINDVKEHFKLEPTINPKEQFLKTGNISSQKMLLTRYKYISYSSFGCVEVYYKQFPGADQVAPSPSTIAEEIQNEPAREWQRCGWMSMNICITIYWESGVTGGQQTNIWRPRENRYLLQCQSRVSTGTLWQDGEGDVALPQRGGLMRARMTAIEATKIKTEVLTFLGSYIEATDGLLELGTSSGAS